MQNAVPVEPAGFWVNEHRLRRMPTANETARVLPLGACFTLNMNWTNATAVYSVKGPLFSSFTLNRYGVWIQFVASYWTV